MDKNLERLILETQRRSEMRLEAQLTLALAADARAMTFCSIMVAAAAALLGFAGEVAQPVPMIIAGLFFLASAISAAFVFRPMKWAAPGQCGSDYATDLRDNVPFHEVVVEVVGHTDEQIADNNQKAKVNARAFRIALALAIAGPVLAGLYMAVAHINASALPPGVAV